jgi:hypothetical protein
MRANGILRAFGERRALLLPFEYYRLLSNRERFGDRWRSRGPAWARICFHPEPGMRKTAENPGYLKSREPTAVNRCE